MRHDGLEVDSETPLVSRAACCRTWARTTSGGGDGRWGDGERGHSRGRFDDEHPRLLCFLTFGLDRRVRLGIVEG